MNADELRRLHEAATEGPWHPERHDDDTLTGYVVDGDGGIVAFVEQFYDAVSSTDIDLIVRLRNAAPRLIALLEAAERYAAAVAAMPGKCTHKEERVDVFGDGYLVDCDACPPTDAQHLEWEAAVDVLLKTAESDPQRGGGG